MNLIDTGHFARHMGFLPDTGTLRDIVDALNGSHLFNHVDGYAHHNGAVYRSLQMGSKGFYLSLHGIDIGLGLTNHK